MSANHVSIPRPLFEAWGIATALTVVSAGALALWLSQPVCELDQQQRNEASDGTDCERTQSRFNILREQVCDPKSAPEATGKSQPPQQGSRHEGSENPPLVFALEGKRTDWSDHGDNDSEPSSIHALTLTLCAGESIV